MKAYLVVVSGKTNKSKVALKLPTVIGRGREANLTIAHPLISRRHCELSERNGLLMLRDMGSLNGTVMQGHRISEAPVAPGCEFTVGPITFRAEYEYAGDLENLPPIRYRAGSAPPPIDPDADSVLDEAAATDEKEGEHRIDSAIEFENDSDDPSVLEEPLGPSPEHAMLGRMPNMFESAEMEDEGSNGESAEKADPETPKDESPTPAPTKKSWWPFRSKGKPEESPTQVAEKPVLAPMPAPVAAPVAEKPAFAPMAAPAPKIEPATPTPPQPKMPLAAAKPETVAAVKPPFGMPATAGGKPAVIAGKAPFGMPAASAAPTPPIEFIKPADKPVVEKPAAEKAAVAAIEPMLPPEPEPTPEPEPELRPVDDYLFDEDLREGREPAPESSEPDSDYTPSEPLPTPSTGAENKTDLDDFLKNLE